MTEQEWIERERDAFEVMVRRDWFKGAEKLKRSLLGYYEVETISRAWYGWIAAKQESRKEIADAIEGARCSDHDQLNVEIARLEQKAKEDAAVIAALRIVASCGDVSESWLAQLIKDAITKARAPERAEESK